MTLVISSRHLWGQARDCVQKVLSNLSTLMDDVDVWNGL